MTNSSRQFDDNSTQVGIYRAIDAASNRATEGLRVAEDYVRFVLDDSHLTEILKHLRHDLRETLSLLPENLLQQSRDTTADVGTQIKTEGEYLRSTAKDLLQANIKRAEQAVRTLEEFSKTIDAEAATKFEAIRYRIYTVAKSIGTNLESQHKLANARLYVLIDGRASEDAFEQLVTELIESGVDILQLRDKNLSDRELLTRAKLLRKLTAGSSTLMIINDRADIAALSDADGVHLGQDELTVKQARSLLGVNKLIGISTHNPDQVKRAIAEGADYLGAGPTFASQTKQFAEFPGLPFIETVSQLTTLPTFAIGGIHLENLPQVLKTGAIRVAVSNAVIEAKQPKEAVLEFQRILNTPDE